MTTRERIEYIKQRAKKRARDEFFNGSRMMSRKEYEKEYGNN